MSYPISPGTLTSLQTLLIIWTNSSFCSLCNQVKGLKQSIIEGSHCRTSIHFQHNLYMWGGCPDAHLDGGGHWHGGVNESEYRINCTPDQGQRGSLQAKGGGLRNFKWSYIILSHLDLLPTWNPCSSQAGATLSPTMPPTSHTGATTVGYISGSVFINYMCWAEESIHDSLTQCQIWEETWLATIVLCLFSG